MKVLFAGGGTLGHIFPCFSVIEKLKKEGSKVYFISGIKENERRILEGNSNIDEVYNIDLQGFKRKISLYNFVSIKKYFKGIRNIKKIMKELNPDLVIGMGGYISAPVLKVALKLKIKTMIHEQNSVYGLVNNIYKRKVNKVLLSFPIETSDRISVVGNPRISEFFEKYYCKRTINKRKVLVVCGSLGASKINDYIIDNIDVFNKLNIEVKLITGNKYYSENEEKISKFNRFPLTIIPFSDEIYNEILDSKLVISRSGATTISEIMGLEKVAIFIPSPNVTNDHQYKNALYFCGKKCAFLVEEKNIETDLIKEIDRILSNDILIDEVENNIKRLVDKDSMNKFYSQILEVVKNSD